MRYKKSLKLLSLTVALALTCSLAACKGFGHHGEDASSEAAASSSKTELLTSLTDEELQELITGQMTIDQISEKRAEDAASAASDSTSGSSEEAGASSSPEEAAPEASKEEPSASSHPESSSGTTATAPAEPAYETEIRSLINQLYAVKAKAEGGLNSAISSAKAEYKALPAEKQTPTKKISICMGKAGELKSLESSCDKEVEEIVSQMRTVLTENGQPTTLADQAMSTYKSEKSAMYSSLMSQLYS